VGAGTADVLVANISPEAVAALAGEFRRTLRSGGVAILSGFETHEVEAVRAALPGGSVKEIRSEGSWALVEWSPETVGLDKTIGKQI
jgi:ribosomal protein L11 methylase PrmA